MAHNLYDVLGISRDSSTEAITEAIERLTRQASALANTAPERSQQLREHIRAAKEHLLATEEERRRYDEELARREEEERAKAEAVAASKRPLTLLDPQLGTAARNAARFFRAGLYTNKASRLGAELEQARARSAMRVPEPQRAAASPQAPALGQEHQPLLPTGVALASGGAVGERLKVAWSIPSGTPQPPGRLWAAIATLAVVGVLSAGWAVYWGVQVVPVLFDGGFATELASFMLVVLAIPLLFGAGCIYLARRLQALDRVARILAIVVCLSAGLAFLLTGVRDALLVAVALACFGLCAFLLFDPVIKSHFRGADPEPAPVVAARVLAVLVACAMFLVGVMFLPLAPLDGALVAEGLLLMGLAVLVFWLSRGLKRGESTARVLITGIALAYLVLSIIAGHGQPGVILPVGLAICVIGLLWLPTSSRDYYGTRPRPTSAPVAATERVLTSVVGALMTSVDARYGPATFGKAPRSSGAAVPTAAVAQLASACASDGRAPSLMDITGANAQESPGTSHVQPGSGWKCGRCGTYNHDRTICWSCGMAASEIEAGATGTPTLPTTVLHKEEPGPRQLTCLNGHVVPDAFAWCRQCRAPVKRDTPVRAADEPAETSLSDIPEPGTREILGGMAPVGSAPSGFARAAPFGTSQDQHAGPGETPPFGPRPPFGTTGRDRTGGAVAPSLAAAAAAVALALDLTLTPAVGGFGMKSVWLISFLHLDIVGFQAAAQIHQYPGVLWWMAVALAAGVIALLAGIASVSSRGRTGAAALALSGVLVAVAGMVATSGTPRGVGAWGTVALGIVLVLSSIAMVVARTAGAPSSTALTTASALATVGLVIAAVLLVTSPGAHIPSYNAGGTVPETTSPAPVTTSVAPTPADDLTNQYHFTETEQGGYSFSGTLSLGTPEKFVPGLSEGNFEAGSVCTINEGTDAVIPGALTVDSTTANFESHPAAGLQWSDSSISVEADFGNGAQCEQNGSLSVSSTDPVSDGGGFTLDFFIVLPDYYSPDYPNGNSASIAQDQLQLVDTTDNQSGNDIIPQTLSGPGSSTSGGFYIPIDAAAAPAITAPASTAPASTAPASTVPASTAPASTAPARKSRRPDSYREDLG